MKTHSKHATTYVLVDAVLLMVVKICAWHDGHFVLTGCGPTGIVPKIQNFTHK